MPSLPAKMKILLILAKISSKNKIKFLTRLLKFRQINTTQKIKVQRKIEDFHKKLPFVICLVTSAVLNKKNSENENKIPGISSLVTATALNTKIAENGLLR